MSVKEILRKFPNQKACIKYLERERWGNNPMCPYCKSLYVGKKNESRSIGRWNCYDCKSSFNVLSGTIFQGTRIPLQKWFIAIVCVDSISNLSARRLGNILDLNFKSAWYMLKRIERKDKFLSSMLRETRESLEPVVPLKSQAVISSAEVYQNAALEYQKKKQYNLALTEYKKAIERFPDCAENYRLRAKLWIEVRHYDNADADYRKANAMN